MIAFASTLEGAETPLFVTHRQADRDSLGAAIGLQALLGRGTVCTPDGVTKSARPLLEATGTDPVERVEDTVFDTVVVLDAPSTERIEPIVPEEPIVIDHHEPDDLRDIASATLIDTDADATAALVARLADRSNWELPPEAALALLVGIFGDTENLTSAQAETIRLAGDLFAGLGHYADEFSDLVDHSPAPGRQNARTLGVLRASGYRSSDWFLAFSRVGGYESAAADALRRDGVDLVLVFSEQSDGYRVTGRASDSFAEQLSLGGSLLPTLIDRFDGSGGGHENAGSATLHTDDRYAIERFALEQVEQQLDTTFTATAADSITR